MPTGVSRLLTRSKIPYHHCTSMFFASSRVPYIAPAEKCHQTPNRARSILLQGAVAMTPSIMSARSATQPRRPHITRRTSLPVRSRQGATRVAATARARPSNHDRHAAHSLPRWPMPVPSGTTSHDPPPLAKHRCYQLDQVTCVPGAQSIPIEICLPMTLVAWCP